MRWKVRSLTRLSILCAAMLFVGDISPAGPVSADAPAAPTAQEEMAALLRPQVRIRKLHLVRPDLIPYPLAYEVLC